MYLNNKERNEAFTGQTILCIFHCTYCIFNIFCRFFKNFQYQGGFNSWTLLNDFVNSIVFQHYSNILN